MQFWRIELIGPAVIQTTSWLGVNRILPTTMFGMRPNADGAVCSFGNSGAQTVMAFRGADNSWRFRTAGVNAGREDFRTHAEGNDLPYDGPQRRDLFEAITGYELGDVAVACFAANLHPRLQADDAEIVTVVETPDQIPS